MWIIGSEERFWEEKSKEGGDGFSVMLEKTVQW